MSSIFAILVTMIKRSLDRNNLGLLLKDPVKNQKENDLIDTSLLLDFDLKDQVEVKDE